MLVLVALLVALRTRDLQTGNLVILTLTLIAIIWYTYFTYQLVVKREAEG